MRQRVIAPVSFDASILAINLLTGIVIARSLGPSGRGEIAAIVTVMQTVAWFASIGGRAAISYHHSRQPEDGAHLIGSWLAVTLPLGIVSIVAAELLLPVLFSAQSAEAIEIARFYLATSLVIIVATIFNGILLGDEEFRVYNIARLLIPVVTILGYLGLVIAGSLTVEGALIVTAVAAAVSAVVAAAKCLSRHGIARPHRVILVKTTWYGLRAHGGDIATFVSARLDLLIMPAFLSAASVGLYSVATNVSSIIATLTGTIAVLVLPVAARDLSRSSRTVIRALHATFLIGAGLGLFLLIVADFAVTLVYGSDFGGAAPALRIMIPGEILEAASTVLWSGMLAANRPLLSSIAYLPTAIITFVGLILFLESGGIIAAAIITTVAYTAGFLITIYLYRRATGLAWRQFIWPPEVEEAAAD